MEHAEEKVENIDLVEVAEFMKAGLIIGTDFSKTSQTMVSDLTVCSQVALGDTSWHVWYELGKWQVPDCTFGT